MVFATVLWDSTAHSQEAKQSPDQIANELIAQACREQPALHGSWVLLEPALKAGEVHFEATFIVDSALATTQIPLLQKLVAGVPLVAPPKIVKLPIARFLADLKVRLEQQRGMRGKFVHGAYFKRPLEKSSLELVLFGRISSADDVQAIERESQVVIKQDPVLQQPLPDYQIFVNGTGLAKIKPSEDWERDLQRIQAQLVADEALHGCWVRLAECYDHAGRFSNYDASLYYDPARGKQQLENLQRTIKSLTKRHWEIAVVTQLPLSQLLESVNLNLEARRNFDGCLVHKAYYQLQPGSIEAPLMVLQGQVDRQDQAEAIRDQICLPLKDADKRWSSFADCVVEADGLTVFATQEGQGALMYSDGLEAFRGARFTAAATAFRQAYLDAPHAVGYRYWHIAAQLARGNRDLAFKHMFSTLNRGQSHLERQQMLRSLESLQGPLRVELMELENRARRELFRYQKLNVPQNEIASGAR